MNWYVFTSLVLAFVSSAVAMFLLLLGATFLRDFLGAR